MQLNTEHPLLILTSYVNTSITALPVEGFAQIALDGTPKSLVNLAVTSQMMFGAVANCLIIYKRDQAPADPGPQEQGL